VLSDDLGITQTLKAGLRIGLTVIAVTAFMALYLRKERPGYSLDYLLPVWLYTGYLSLGVASLLWTTSFNYSLLQLFMDIENFVFVYFFIRLLHGYQSLYPGGFFDLPKIIAPAISLIAGGFAIGMLVNPDQFYRLTHGGEVSRLGGYIINPNELGMLLMVGIAVLIPLLIKEGKYRISILLLIAGLIYLLVLTGSRSSFVSLLLVAGVYAFQQKSKNLKIFLGILMLVSIPLLGIKIFIKQGDIQEVMSLTGRLPFWRDLLTYNFPKEPWFGYGYMRIDYGDKFESLNAYAGAMTHNTFLQVLLGLGLTGLFLVMLQVSSFLHALFTNEDKVLKLNVLLIFIPLLVNSFTEFGIFGETNYGIFFYLILVFSVSSEPASASVRIYGKPKTNVEPVDLPLRSTSVA
jgi:exopolysaccharide production protein ExoQ